MGHGRKKGRNARERDSGFTGDGSEGDRGGEAQTGPGLVILRYHVLRITVSVTCARAMCDSPWCVYVHTDVTILLSRYSSSSLFLSPFFFLSYFSLCPSYPLSRALFSLLPYHLSFSFYPPAATGGSVVFFLPGGTRDSRARAHTLEADRLQRVLKYRHTRGTHSMERCIRWRTLKTPERSVLE